MLSYVFSCVLKEAHLDECDFLLRLNACLWRRFEVDGQQALGAWLRCVMPQKSRCDRLRARSATVAKSACLAHALNVISKMMNAL